jgi:GNAT superfamily N-acetyltransferase
LTFPAGQLVAVDLDAGRVVGMAASLIVTWDDYDVQASWRDFTDNGTFANHDPSGRTLYAADVMVDPRFRRRGIGSRLYAARRALLGWLGLTRIRSGARLRKYREHAAERSAEEYVARIVDGSIQDPTLSFQLRQGFRVLAVAPDYLPRDPKSLGYAAVVEWRDGESAGARDPA